MARFRNITDEAQTIHYGVAHDPNVPFAGLKVEPGGVLDVADWAAASYAVQPDVWEPGDELAQAVAAEQQPPAPQKPAKKPTAKTPKKRT